jgi:hypothetical protein
MSVKVAPVFPASAPLTRNPKVPQKYRPVLWEQYLLPTLAENLATLLGISVGFLPESIVGAVFERGKFKPGTGWALARFRINLQEEQVPAFLLQPLAEALDWGPSACAGRQRRARHQWSGKRACSSAKRRRWIWRPTTRSATW